MIIMIVLVVAGIVMYSSGGYSLGSIKGAGVFAEAYGSWMTGLGKNMIDITAYAVKRPWLPQ